MDDLRRDAALIGTTVRLARVAAAPVLVVHVPESAAVDAAEADEPAENTALGEVLARFAADGIDASSRTIASVTEHDQVGAELLRVAREVGARAIVVGPPDRGPLRALAHPSADRTLFDHSPCPVVVVPPTDPAPVPAARHHATPASVDRSVSVVRGRVHDGDGRPSRPCSP